MTEKNYVIDQRSKVEEAFQARCRDSMMTFVRGLIIPSAYGPQLFEHCMARHQRVFFEDIEPSMIALQQGTMPPNRRWWMERTKKGAKDSDLAAICLWLLAFAVRPLQIQAGAADRDQAGIVKKRMTDLMWLNSWASQHVIAVQWNVRNRKANSAYMDIAASDVAGSHGETPDLLILNELSHVTKWEFLENLMDNADGVPQGVQILATNAGMKGSKAEVLRKNALKSKAWVTHLLSKPAPWHSKADLEETRKRSTTRGRFRRLWYGEWQGAGGDAVDASDIDRCFQYAIGPLTAPEPGWDYIGGLDLGVSNDHSGLIVLGVHVPRQLIRVAYLQAWEPSPETGEIDLQAVQDACLAVNRLFRMRWFGYDPYQAVLMAQQLRAKRVPMQEVSFVGKNLNVMATVFVDVLRSGQLQAYDDLEGRLRRDMGKFNIQEKSYGLKLEAVGDETGHADVGTALVIALPRAADMLKGRPDALGPDDVLADDDLTPLSEAEVAAMPDELRELYDMGEEMQQETSLRGDYKYVRGVTGR